MKILLIEDDEETARYVADGLTREGHVVDRTASGRDGLFLAAGESYDVIVVDRLLPELDGLAVVKTIRRAEIKTPVLFLTAVDGINDRVEGLEAGGDDYLVAVRLCRVVGASKRPRAATGFGPAGYGAAGW
jgi:two-component system OmpR family response regulator